MKTILLSSLFMMLSWWSMAQSSGCDNRVKSVSIRDDGAYVLPYNSRDANWTKTMNQKMIDKIWDLYNRNLSIKQIESNSSGDYVILWGRNDAQWDGIPSSLSKKIIELNKEGKEIKNIALRDDGAFVILWGYNDAMWTVDVPEKLIEKIKELNKAGKEIQQVTLVDGGDYIIRWGRNEAQWTTSIPKALSNKILELNRNGNRIDYIELTDDQEFVIVWDDSHSMYSDGIPTNLKQKLRELSCYDSDDESVDPPVITWTYPTESVTYVTEKLQNIKVCISSTANVDEVKLYINGTLSESKRDFVIKKAGDNDNCTLNYSKSVYLDEGENKIQVIATNIGGSTTSYTRTIKVKASPDIVTNNPSGDKGDRLALIIGNATYHDVNARLRNPKNDADAMSERLTALGFKVIKATDADQQLMKDKIREFGRELKGKKVGLFYYAGHGFQIDGVNYLVPVDADIEDQADAKDACVSVNYLLDKMEVSGTETNLVVLDACRNNPFRSWTRNSNSGGLSSLDSQPLGSLIAFATQPGNVAEDGSGSNGLYTSAWLKHLQPGKNIYEVLTNVNNTVTTSSTSRQVPWFNSSLQGMFIF